MAKADPVVVPVENLSKDPYRSLVAYPNPEENPIESRIRQLIDPGISSLELQGALRIGRLSILGKGVVGLVFTGYSGGERVAVKIRRVDSRRKSMGHEAEMMRIANYAGIGPECLGSSQDILKMQFVDGRRLPTWLSSLRQGKEGPCHVHFQNTLPTV